MEPKAAPGDPQVGEVHGGCRLERLLGRGAMGSAYLATRLADGAGVVLKFLAVHMAKDATLRARFEREWEALRKIHDHPNVVRVHFVGGGERPFIQMELVQGKALDVLLREQGRLAPKQAVEVARDVARGLSAVHAHGLIHRDVKPGNVILGPGGQAKIVDFGLAKDLFLTGLTKPGQLLGTAFYMAPEQWEDEGIDTRIDVFALGATLYHLLCGEPPFASDDLDDIADMALSGEYPPPSEHVPEVPRDLELVIHQMLAPELRYRYARIEDALEDLERVLRGEPVAAPSLTAPGGAPVPLLPGEWFTIGCDPSCEVRLQGAGLELKHAQLRREERGYVLRDLKSAAGTFVGAERVAPGQARLLVDGDRLRLGQVEVAFQDPRAGSSAVSFLQDVERVARPLPIVETLAAANDPRSALALLEQLAPNPWEDAQTDQHLAHLFGPDIARAVAERRRPQAERLRASLPQRLVRLSGVPAPPAEPLAWLAWWHQARLGAPAQVGPPLPPRAERLVLRGPAPPELSLAGQGLVLIGRDEKCHVRIESQEVPRLAATLLRLHRRWVVLSGGGPAAIRVGGQPTHHTFLDPGVPLEVGPVQVALDVRVEPSRPVGDGLIPIDPASYDVLEAQAHASVAGALVGFLFAARHTEWIDAAGRELFPGDPAAAEGFSRQVMERLRARYGKARELLPRILGVPSADCSAEDWERLLSSRRAQLGPQVAPAGWSS